MKKYAIGVDIGGSHISSAAVDLTTGSIISESFVEHKINNKASADEIFKKWEKAIEGSISKINKLDLEGIGFAMPGPFDYENGIALFDERVLKYEKLFQINVAERIQKDLELGSADKVRFMNDATSFAVGEAWVGKAAGYKKSIAITLGTGFGSAFIDSGIPVLEGDNIPKLGCVWHLPFKHGIADDYFSTRWFVKTFEKYTGQELPGVKEISKLADNGDVKAINLFFEFGRNLGEFLSPWLMKFNDDILVVGGNMALAFNLWGPVFKAALDKQNIQIIIEISELKESAAIAGSARLFDESFWLKTKPLLSKM